MKNKKILISAAVLAAAVGIGLLVWLAVSLTRPGISTVGLPTELSIAKGETAQLEIEYGAEGNASAEALEKAAAELTLEWTSGDEDVATVDANGLVTAVEAGTADITVSVPDTELTSTCKVTVTVPVEGVQAPDEMQLTINGTASKEIGAKLVPEDATGVKLVYESSDENIATVDENGVVTAVANGECVITTSVAPIVEETADSEPAEDTDSSASTDASAPASSAASETANSGSEPIDIEETSSVDYSSMTAETKVYVATAATGLKLSSDSGSVRVGNSVNVSVYTEPEEADAAKAEEVKYTSSDESVATVVGTTEGDAAFTVKGVKAGSATITIEYQGLTATYEVTVTKAVQTSSGGGSNTGAGSTGGSSGGSTSTGGGTTTTTPPSGGGSVTPPAGGGETTTPPSGGGGGTTNPPSGGGETTPPAPTPGPGADNDTNLGDTHNPGPGENGGNDQAERP